MKDEEKKETLNKCMLLYEIFWLSMIMLLNIIYLSKNYRRLFYYQQINKH